MTPSRAYSVVLAAVLVPLCAPPARAAGAACSPMVIEADRAVLDRWPELPARIRAAFGARDDIDSCARVQLAMRESSIVLSVVLPDDRLATRSVSSVEDLMPSLEALLLVPRPAPASALEAHAPPSRHDPPQRKPPLMSPEAASVRDAEVRTDDEAPSTLRVELSLLTGARFGDGTTSVGIGALSLLEIYGWLAGFEGRVDQYRGPVGGDSSVSVLRADRSRARIVVDPR